MTRKTARTAHPPSPGSGMPSGGTRNRFPQRAIITLGATIAAALGAAGPAMAEAVSVAPLPSSEYQVHRACRAPTPEHASCLALELIPRTREAHARNHPLGMTHNGPIQAGNPKEGADGLRPLDLQSAYFPGELPEAPAAAPQTIALVDAYNDPEAEADLAVYDQEFGIEACTEANGCLEKVNQRGERGSPPFPASEAEREAEVKVCEDGATKGIRDKACNRVEEAEGWAVEISTDIEVAHAICQRHCRILLVEADTDSYVDLEAAEETAVRMGREATGAEDTDVSNSWGGPEPEPLLGGKANDSAAFNHPGTVIAAAAGDDGYLNWTSAAESKESEEEYYVGADYPASSPHVVAVGGTRLTLHNGAWQSETVWNDDPRGGHENYGAGGSGCSAQFEAQVWQSAVPDWSKVGCEDRRAVADVSADGDPYSGVAVYDSVPDPHEVAGVGNKIETVNTPLEWWPIGGTSVASPIIASMFALAGGSNGVEYPSKTLYEHLETDLLHSVTAGGNGECDDLYTSCGGSMSPLSDRFAFDCGSGVLICNAAAGYNGPTGVGTPNGIGALEPGSAAEVKKWAEEAAERRAKETAAEQAKEAREAKEREAREAEAQRQILEKEEQAEAERAAARKAEEEAAAAAAAEEAAATGDSSGGVSGTSPTQPATGAGNGTGSASQSGATGDKSAGSHSPSSSSPGTGAGRSGQSAVSLSNLALTARAVDAIDHGQPTLAQVAFAFTLSAPTRVRVTLARQIRVDGRPRWVLEPSSLTFTAGGGRSARHLEGQSPLASGRYRLTLTPAHGGARSLVFALL
jgi:hypothetical protein